MAAITTTYSFTDRVRDNNYQLADTQTITTSAAATVGGSAKVLDLGSAVEQRFDVTVDVSTVGAATGRFSHILIQGSNDSGFASGNVNLAAMLFGDTASIGESADDAGNKQVVISGSTVKNGTRYRYIRLYVLSDSSSASMIINQAWYAHVRG